MGIWSLEVSVHMAGVHGNQRHHPGAGIQTPGSRFRIAGFSMFQHPDFKMVDPDLWVWDPENKTLTNVPHTKKHILESKSMDPRNKQVR